MFKVLIGVIIATHMGDREVPNEFWLCYNRLWLLLS